MSETKWTTSVAGDEREVERQVESRLKTVELEVRSLRNRLRLQAFGFTGTLILLGALVVRPDLFPPIAGVGNSGVVTARQLVLVGNDGRPRGDWSVDGAGSSRLTMLDHQQRERLTLTLSDGGFPGILHANAAGQRRVALGLLPDETTSLVFADGEGTPRAVLGLTRGDAASLVLADAEGVSRIGFGLDGSGLGSVILPEETEPEAATPPASR